MRKNKEKTKNTLIAVFALFMGVLLFSFSASAKEIVATNSSNKNETFYSFAQVCPEGIQKPTQEQEQALKNHEALVERNLAAITRILDDKKISRYNKYAYINNKVFNKDEKSEELKLSLVKKKWRCVDLSGRNLQGADLAHSDLRGSLLNGVNLSGANLVQADFSFTKLLGANLTGTRLNGADFNNTELIGTDFSGIEGLNSLSFNNTNLTKSKFINSDLSSSTFKNTDLSFVDFRGSNLEWVNFTNSNLDHACLSQTSLLDSDFTYAKNIDKVLFDPDLNVPCDKIGIWWRASSTKQSFEDITPLGFYSSALKLREEGFIQQARKITYAYKYNEKRYIQSSLFSLNPLKSAETILQYLFYVAFEYTTFWGLSPFRALGLLLCIIFFVAFYYYKKMLIEEARKSEILVHLEYLTKQITTPPKIDTQTMTTHDYIKRNLENNPIKNPKFHMFCLALWLSLVNSCRIGVKELDIGTWLTHMHKQKLTFSTIGQTNKVIIVQSIIGKFLIVLFLATFFGAPFNTW